MAIERRTILFSGRVQGVGFRMTAVELSRGMNLSGTVRNLDDGSVELIAEGESAEIDQLVDKLREHFGTFIRNVEQARTPGTIAMPPGIRVTH